jgi:hypothetical protein
VLCANIPRHEALILWEQSFLNFVEDHVNKIAILAVSGTFALLVPSAMGDIIPFDLLGKAGAGLLSGNENGAIAGTPGSGGELVAGITYDTATNVLTLNAGWGVGNGFTNLSGDATMGHLHGPVTSAAPAGFLENASVKYGLDNVPGSWNPSATGGGYVGIVNILEADEAALLAGRFYMNVHTGINGGGEIRGNLVAVPEPASIGIGALAAAALLLRRKR